MSRKARRIKPYVQFSKRMVTFVSVAVTVVCAAGMALAGYMLESAESVVAIVKAYIGYAMVCFAAYSGNSAVEKWLVYSARETDENDDESTTNG